MQALPTHEEIFGEPPDDDDSPPSASKKKSTEKKSRGDPEGMQRVHLQLWEKIKTVQHYAANPKMPHPKMIAWCFSTFKMPKRLSAGAMSKLLKADSVKHYLQLAKTETNPHVLNSKSCKGGHFPVLEQELFSWFRRKETQHAALTDDIICEKAKQIAEKMQIIPFKASGNWILQFKKRHGISQVILHGEGASADKVHGSSPHDIYNMDETGLNYLNYPSIQRRLS